MIEIVATHSDGHHTIVHVYDRANGQPHFLNAHQTYVRLGADPTIIRIDSHHS